MRLWGGGDGDALRGGAGDDRLHGGEGDDSLTGGAGNDTLYGEEGSDVFVFASGDGVDTIADFTPGEDMIDLRGYPTITDFSDLTISEAENAVTIDLGGGDQLTLIGVGMSDLGAEDFLFFS